MMAHQELKKSHVRDRFSNTTKFQGTRGVHEMPVQRRALSFLFAALENINSFLLGCRVAGDPTLLPLFAIYEVEIKCQRSTKPKSLYLFFAHFFGAGEFNAMNGLVQAL